MISELRVTVTGRPAPQGSKRLGAAGQLREQSAYLPAWRAAVKRAIYERYRDLGVRPADLPLLRGPIAFGVRFRMAGTSRIDGPPDLDKLLRASLDALTAARVWEDDSRVVEVLWLSKVPAGGSRPGADLYVRSAGKARVAHGESGTP
jgi:Holliday junction resolvase RusA-like endonuclease